MTSNFPA